MLMVLDKAQTALLKFKFDAASQTKKGLGNVIKWVLPEAMMDFLLKDLQK